MDELKAMAEKLAAQSESRQAKVVITGIRQGSFLANFCYENGKVTVVKTKKIGESAPVPEMSFRRFLRRMP